MVHIGMLWPVPSELTKFLLFFLQYAVQQLKEYDGKKLVSITKEGLELEETGAQLHESSWCKPAAALSQMSPLPFWSWSVNLPGLEHLHFQTLQRRRRRRWRSRRQPLSRCAG